MSPTLSEVLAPVALDERAPAQPAPVTPAATHTLGQIVTPPGRQTYGQILKSSALMGGSTVANIAVSVIRAKAMALLLGPSGVGLVGLYTSILNLTHSVAGMGINQSGVRQIAEAAGSGDTRRVARTAAVLRRASMFLGLLGAVLLVVFCRQISMRTFGTTEFAAPVALLSLAVFFSSISDGQAALIQGMRRITDLARIGVWGVVLGTGITLSLIYVLRERGVVPSLVSVAAMTLLISWWYRRKIHIAAVSLTLPEVREEAGALLKLGAVFMASMVLTTGAAYVIRILVRTHVGLDAAGLYQSAWSIGGLYVGFILQAMGSDFYPRLTAVANDNTECNRLVNEQAQIGLLLAGPGVLATLTFAPLVIALFYAATFVGAVEPLRWICLGMALRVISWPMGYIILAKGARSIFFWVEVGATVVHVGLAFVLVRWFGLAGATMAFFGLYIWHGIFVYVIVHRLTGFRWSAANQRTGLLFLPLIGAVFSGFFLLPLWAATIFGFVASVASGIYSLRVVCRLVPLDRVPRIARDLLAWFRISSSPADISPSLDAPSEV
jgi:O-antigen/teichoic acid export membrane protein